MRTRSLLFSLALLPILPGAAKAQINYDRPVNVITSNYDLVDTTYIDRGRLDGVKVGDKFQVKFRDGKLAAIVVVTGVYERMSSVKIQDSWLLKDGQLANYHQRPMIVPLEPNARRVAPANLAAKSKKGDHTSLTGSKTPSDMTTTATGPDAGLPAVSDANKTPDTGLPPATDKTGATAPDAGLPPASDANNAPDAGLPAAAGPGTAPAASTAGQAPANTSSAAPDAGLPALDLLWK